MGIGLGVAGHAEAQALIEADGAGVDAGGHETQLPQAMRPAPFDERFDEGLSHAGAASTGSTHMEMTWPDWGFCSSV